MDATVLGALIGVGGVVLGGGLTWLGTAHLEARRHAREIAHAERAEVQRFLVHVIAEVRLLAGGALHDGPAVIDDRRLATLFAELDLRFLMTVQMAVKSYVAVLTSDDPKSAPRTLEMCETILLDTCREAAARTGHVWGYPDELQRLRDAEDDPSWFGRLLQRLRFGPRPKAMLALPAGQPGDLNTSPPQEEPPPAK